MFLLLCSSALAQDFVLVGSENRIDALGVVPRAKAIVDIGVVPKLSVTATFVASPSYAEVYVGPTWSPAAIFSIGVAGGMETAEAPWRAMGYASLHYKSLHLLGIAEYGGSGLWYKAVATYDVGPVSLGAMAQRFDGVGPRIGANYAHFELWAAPLYDSESASVCGLVGLNWTPPLK